MKKLIYILSIVFLFVAQHGISQNIGDLEGIYYQAVALDDEAKEIVGVDVEAKPLHAREIGVRFTITKGLDGQVQWEEIHITTTDDYGLFTLVIGQGQVSSSLYARMLDIPWIDADQFLQVEISAKNDGDYKLVSNQKFMTVPYAFYADDIADDAITTAKILNEEIIAEDVAEGAIESSEILNETILAEDIATGSVESSEILNETILSEDIAASAITTSEILNETILAEDIAEGSVESSKILNGTILNEDIADNTINLKGKVTDTLSVANGGTGQGFLTDNSILIGNGTGGIDILGIANDGQIPIGVSGGKPVLANLIAGDGIEITNSAGSITITSPPISSQTSSDGTFQVNPGSNGIITGSTAWTTPNSLKVTPPDGKAFEMGDIFLVSADSDLKGCLLSAYLESIGGDGRANVQVVIFNPSPGDVTLASTITLKFLLVK